MRQYFDGRSGQGGDETGLMTRPARKTYDGFTKNIFSIPVSVSHLEVVTIIIVILLVKANQIGSHIALTIQFM